MGGCRCTYRNCTVKSDGQTHMFHYPVFDKVRCHQWLMNAQRQDFLDLKVSQLKNRVVCQHHFKKDNFMNFKMDKLTFEAVPTENGPFCEPVKELKPEFSHEVPIVYAITLDDIENDQLSFNEKKATFSVKYADFLTNSDIDTINASFDCTLKNVDSSLDNMHTLKDFCDNSQKTSTYGQTNRISLPAVVNNKSQSQPMLVVQPFSDSDNKVLNNDWVVGSEKVDIKSNSGISPPKTMSRRNNRIKIISEKKISKPFPIKGKLEPVSPSVVLRVRNKKTNNETNNIENMEIRKSIEPQVLKNASNTENNSLLKMQPRNKKSLLKSSNNSSNKSSCDISPMKGIINREQTSPSVSMQRNKIPPERVAAIEEKRSFNKKLRDMIEFCLDDQDKNINEIALEKNLAGNQNYVQNVLQDVQPKRTMRTRKCKEKSESNKNVVKHLEPEQGTTQSRQSSLGGVNELHIMSSLEARLKMMEDTLLSRIDQNSKQIVDLKKDLPNLGRKQSTPTQTSKFDNEEVYKKHLFNEISKYLSPSTNSSIYEELFINKYGQKMSHSTEHNSVYSSPKRRRRML